MLEPSSGSQNASQDVGDDLDRGRLRLEWGHCLRFYRPVPGKLFDTVNASAQPPDQSSEKSGAPDARRLSQPRHLEGARRQHALRHLLELARPRPLALPPKRPSPKPSGCIPTPCGRISKGCAKSVCWKSPSSHAPSIGRPPAPVRLGFGRAVSWLGASRCSRGWHKLALNMAAEAGAEAATPSRPDASRVETTLAIRSAARVASTPS